MLLKKSVYILPLLFAINNYLFCDIKINGKIISEKNNKPIQDVNIYVRDQKKGTTSDMLGNFELILQKDSTYLVDFSHIAYEDKFIETKSEKFMNIKMQEVFLMLDDIVVTSMKCEYALSDIPVYSELINKNEIVESGSVSVADLLEQHTGISKVYNAHGMLDYNLMGLDSKYVLVLKNGKPVAGKFQDMIDLDQILVSNIDRIEIIKGPGSSLHGSDAIGGVINIITEEIPDDSKISLRLKKSLFNTSSNENESQSSGNLASFSISKKLGKWHLGSTGIFQDLLNQESITPLNKDKIRKINLNGELHWTSEKNKNQFGLMLEYFGQNDSGRELLSTGDELSSNNTDINRMSTTLIHKLVLSEKLNFNQSINRSNYNRKYKQTGVDDFFAMNNIASESVINFDGKFQLILGKNNLLFGLNFVRPSFNNQRLADTTHVLTTSGFFIQNEYSRNKRLKIVYGLRTDNYEENETINPRLAVMYKPINNYKVRLSIGKGFRVPSIIETFIDFHNIDQGYVVNGNPNLKPEKSLGSSINIEFSNEKNLRLNGLIYHNDFSDKILTEQLNDLDSSPRIFTYNNISEATYRGIELFADYIHSNRLTSKMNINLRDDYDGNGKRLKNSIPYSTNLELSFLIKPIKSKIHVIQSQNYRHATNTSFGIMDIMFNVRLSKSLKMRTGLKNLTNYVDKDYGPFKGRSIFLEVSNN